MLNSLPGSVGGHTELAAPGEARLEGATLALGHQLLHREEEGDILASRRFSERVVVSS